MYRTILLIILLMFPIHNFLRGQNISKANISIMDINKIRNEIERYVNHEINEWQTQGKYENTNDYKKRVTSRTRNAKIEYLLNKRINEIANEVINLNIQRTEYDPDNEVYKIFFIGLPQIYLQVPVKNGEALSFDKNINQFVFYSSIYTLTDEGFALLELTLRNPQNLKSYKYNYQNKLIFKRNKVELTFEPVRINTGEFRINVTEEEGFVSIVEEINVDRDLPKSRMSQPNAVAVVIGNRDYQKISSVAYAVNDARSVKKYLINVMGFREGNILYYENVSKADFEEIFGLHEFHEARLYNMIKPNISDVFIFYSGHGAPGLRNLKGYFVPVDCDPNYLEFRGYSQETFYNNLSKLPAKSVTVIIDACFSGENVHQDISSILPKVQAPIFMIPNGVLLSSSRAQETSFWYNDQEHGLFTYFFLRALKDKLKSDSNKDGKISFKEIYDYLSSPTEGIPYFARRLHGKAQNPTIQGNAEKIIVKY